VIILCSPSRAVISPLEPSGSACIRLRLPLEYTVLQQPLFFGTQKHGYLVRDGEGGYKPDPRGPARVHRFVEACQKAGVKALSEGGLSPAAYGHQWDSVLATPWQANLAFAAKVSLQYPNSEDYPASAFTNPGSGSSASLSGPARRVTSG